MSPVEDSADAAGSSGPADVQLADGRHGSLSRRVRRWLLGAFAVAVIVVILVAVWAQSFQSEDSGDSAHQVSHAQSAWAAIAQAVPLDPDRRYTDEELGMYDLIDNIVFNTPSYIRFRTVGDAVESDNRRDEYISSVASGHERERLAFEREVEDIIKNSYWRLPPDLGIGGVLELAFVEAMRRCTAEAGYPEIHPTGASEEELAHYEIEFGLSSDAFYDLRHECAKQAATYPTLDPEMRDGMLNSVRKHYLLTVHDYIRDHDVVEVPVEHHEGDARPLEESYIGRCLELEIAERESCAEHYRVKLTDEQKTAPVPERVEVDESAPYPLVGQPCPFSEFPGEVIIDREGSYCDRFENLEFVINYPETSESENYVSNLFWGGERLLNCPTSWVTDDEGKCRYPRPEEAALRDAFVAEHPEHAEYHNWPLYSSRYPDKN